MSAGKRVGVIILVLFLCAAAVVCGLVAAEYYTRQTGFGGAEIPLFIEKDADERIWLQVHALGMEQSYELTPLLAFLEKVQAVVDMEPHRLGGMCGGDNVGFYPEWTQFLRTLKEKRKESVREIVKFP